MDWLYYSDRLIEFPLGLFGVALGTVILPARPGRPRDKAKAESGVLIAERRVLAALRDHTFFSLAALNECIRERLAALNAEGFQKLDGTRRGRLEEERALFTPLPEHRYDLARWGKAKVNIDYHVAVDNHFYSVPYQYVGELVDVRRTESIVELYLDGQRIAAHPRSYYKGGFTTTDGHRPKSHQAHQQWTPQRMIDWAASIGPATAEVVCCILKSKPHPEQGYRSCLGIIRLAKAVGPQRMENACRHARHHELCSYPQIKSILENRLDQEHPALSPARSAPVHENLRGPDYYR